MPKRPKATNRSMRTAAGKTEWGTWLKIKEGKPSRKKGKIQQRNVKTKILKAFRDGVIYYILKKAIDFVDGG